MRSKLVRIGNSRGVRLPKAVIEHAGLRDVVDIEFEDGAVIIRCGDRPRAGWAAAFARISAAGDDALLDAGRLGRTRFDDEEWEWA
jgi:antitoxin MazE